MQLERQLQEDRKSTWLDAHVSVPRLAAGGGLGCGGVADDVSRWRAKREGGAQAMTDRFIDTFVQVSNSTIGAQHSWANQTRLSSFHAAQYFFFFFTFITD